MSLSQNNPAFKWALRAAHEALKDQLKDPYYLRGSELLKRGSHRRAARAFRQALRAHPSHMPVHLKLGIAYMRLRQYEAAASEYRRVLSLVHDESPCGFEAHLGLGKALLFTDKVDEAISELERASSLNRAKCIPCYWLGEAHRLAGRQATAITWHERCLSISPEQTMAMEGLAECHFALGDYEKAADHFIRLIELGWQPGPMQVRLGCCFGELKRPADEEDAYRKALRHNRWLGSARLMLGNCLWKRRTWLLGQMHMLIGMEIITWKKRLARVRGSGARHVSRL